VDQALAESFGLDKPRGALVSNVERGGPADEAGLKEGDVILAFDGQPVESAGQLPSAVAAAKPGRKVELQVWREGASRKIDVTLGEVTDGNQVAANTEAAEGGRLGVSVRPLSPAERSSAQLEAGLVVEEVAGAAAEAGIQPGDVVLSANGRPVGDVEQLRSIVSAAKNHVALLVQRGTARIFVPVELA
jgi:serine protease Do